MAKAQHSKNSRRTALPQNLFPPIKDPDREKRQVEKDWFGWTNALAGKSRLPANVLGIPIEAFEERIVEIYRLCYEQPSAKQNEIIRDFAAHFPRLMFDARWLRDLIRKAQFYGFGSDTLQGKLLLSIANGLRSAAAGTRPKRQMHADKLLAARFARTRISTELAAWDKTLQRESAAPEWIRERASEKATEVIGMNPRLKTHQQKLRQLLEKKQLYRASVLIAARSFGVRERDLHNV